MSRHLMRGEYGLPASSKRSAIRTVDAQFTFRELASWRDSVSLRLSGIPGMVYIDMDEGTSRVSIAFSKDARENGEALVRLQAQRFGIPSGALRFVTSAPYVAAVGQTVSKSATAMGANSSMTVSDSLWGPYNEFGGGFQIQAPGTCSLGVIADSASVRMAIAASHCSNTMYSLEGSTLKDSYSTHTLGYEAADPAATHTISGYPARNSDANLYRVYTDSVITRRGAIARLSTRGTNFGSIAINQSNPWLRVTSTEHGQTLGATVEKIGRTTGWTYGSIVATCVDIVYSARSTGVGCVTRALVKSGAGDSGGPIFMMDDASDSTNNAVKFMGILNGVSATTTYNGNSAGDTISYSGYRSFENDLGILDMGILNPKTSMTVGAPSVTASFSYPSASLSWSATYASEGSFTSKYQIYTYWDEVSYDEYSVATYNSSAPTTSWDTSTSYSIPMAFSAQVSCNPYLSSGRLYHYLVIAFNQGVASPASNDSCFQ